jgi:hypothetical protein
MIYFKWQSKGKKFELRIDLSELILWTIILFYN